MSDSLIAICGDYQTKNVPYLHATRARDLRERLAIESAWPDWCRAYVTLISAQLENLFLFVAVFEMYLVSVDDFGKEDGIYKMIDGRVYCHDSAKKGWALVSTN